MGETTGNENRKTKAGDELVEGGGDNMGELRVEDARRVTHTAADEINQLGVKHL